jgi:RNA polymerase sigma factor (sigma-70 family)
VDEFQAHRDRLRTVAYRMLGSASDAEDAVQEAWLRLARTAPGEIRNTGGWLTTVVAHICLDTLRARAARREVDLVTTLPADGPDPEREALLADSVGLALLVVLDTLSPAERLAFVLHDTFAVPFDEIALILGRTVPATKMLASRARRRVRLAETPETDPLRQREVVEAFVAASREGDFDALLALLDPDVTVRTDIGTPARLRGARAVARKALVFSGSAEHARFGFVDGVPAALVRPAGRLVTAMTFVISGGRIVAIDIVADQERLSRMVVGLRAAGDKSAPGGDGDGEDGAGGVLGVAD